MVLQRRRRSIPEGVPSGIEGQSPDGSLVRVDLSAGRRTILFMTSSCTPCRAVWASLDRRRGVVVVTPSPSTESRRRVAALAPEGVLVVMSSQAWFAFAPGPAPWRIVVDDGEIVESAKAGA